MRQRSLNINTKQPSNYVLMLLRANMCIAYKAVELVNITKNLK